MTFFGKGAEILEVEAEVKFAIGPAISEVEGHDIARTIEAIVGKVCVGALVVDTVALIFV